MSEHRRFFVDPSSISSGSVTIVGSTARQIVKVLRLREGDSIQLFDGTGAEYAASITSTSKDTITAQITNTRKCFLDPTIQLTLAISLPKSDKMDLIVQKTTELGISEIVVVNSERTISRPDGVKFADRLDRWRRIAAEAAEQCGRSKVPQIEGGIEFVDLAKCVGQYSLALIAWEEEQTQSLKQTLRARADAQSILLIIGPEGGFPEREVEMVKSAGAVSVSLGRRVLRSETAAIAACAVIMYEIENEL